MDNLANAPGKHRGSMRDLDSFLLSVRNFTRASGPHHNNVPRQTQTWRSDQESFLRRNNKRNSAVARSQDQVKNKNLIWWMMWLKQNLWWFLFCTMNAINKTPGIIQCHLYKVPLELMLWCASYRNIRQWESFKEQQSPQEEAGSQRFQPVKYTRIFCVGTLDMELNDGVLVTS